jgi:DNA-binding transcriptional LysR family regulator
MDREILPYLPIFLAVARRGGFGAAAKELGMSASAVSHAVRALEQRLGTPVFLRTTRSVALTDGGRSLLAAVEPSLANIGEEVERLRADKDRVSGLLRINLPRMALSMVLTPVILEMGKRYPDLVVEAYVDYAITDIVAQGFDAGVRLGEMIAQDMVAVRLTPPFRTAVAASPAYLERRGTPKTLEELKAHDRIGLRLMSARTIYAWEFEDGGEDVAVETQGALVTNDPTYAHEMAEAGVGLTYGFEPIFRKAFDSGRLVEVLRDYACQEPGLFLYYPQRATQAAKLRAFIDTAKDVLRL